MIVPMKKISLVVLEKERREALKALRKTGVVHIEEVKGESEELSTFKLKKSKIELAVSLLSEKKVKKISGKDSLSKEEAYELSEKIIACTSKLNGTDASPNSSTLSCGSNLLVIPILYTFSPNAPIFEIT